MDLLKLIVVYVTILISGCKESFEAARATSPDGSLDVVVVESDAGATTGYTYEVCVVPHGKHCGESDAVAWLNDAVRNKSAAGTDAVWQSSTQLEVRYPRRETIKKPTTITITSITTLGSHLLKFTFYFQNWKRTSSMRSQEPSF